MNPGAFAGSRPALMARPGLRGAAAAIGRLTARQVAKTRERKAPTIGCARGKAEVVASPGPDPDRSEKRRGSGVSLQTLIIASIASAAAAYGASRIWGTGTLISAAVTPVVVALVSEFLRRPVETVATSAKRLPPVHPLPAMRPRADATPRDPTDAVEDPEHVGMDPTSPAQPPSTPAQARPPRRVEAAADSTPGVGPTTVRRTAADAGRRHWRPAVLTGLLAFAIVVALFTVPDLIAGHSVTGNGQPTTFFGASTHKDTKTSLATAATTTSSPTTVTTTTPATSTATATATTKTSPTSPTSPHATSTTPSPVTPTTTTSPAP